MCHFLPRRKCLDTLAITVSPVPVSPADILIHVISHPALVDIYGTFAYTSSWLTSQPQE